MRPRRDGPLAITFCALLLVASACERKDARGLAPDAASQPSAMQPSIPTPPAAPKVTTVAKGVLGRFARAVVSSANPRASEEGAKILAAGGNAMDAAIACALVLGVVEPHSAGLGGGGFLLHYEAKTGVVRALDYRERAPRRAHRDLYRRDGGIAKGARRRNRRPRSARITPTVAPSGYSSPSLDGHLAVAVPGTVAGLFEAHRAHGRLPWKRLFEPAARIADTGYEIAPRVAEVMQKRAHVLKRYDATARMFLPGGRVPKAGDRLRHPDLAATLRTLGEHGPAPFYTGAIARKIADEVARGGGLVDLQDLARYKPIWREPVRGRFRGVDVVAMPPPSSGGVLLVQMLSMLARDPIESMPFVARVHLLVEVMRRAYADRATFLGDPDFVRVPVRALLDPRYAAARRAQIDGARATPSSRVGAGAPPRTESENTTHLSVIDADGNAVALTQSINYMMGAAVVVPGTGILLNDTMDDFSLAPGVANKYGFVGGEANAIDAFKTPLSSMTPTFVLRGGKLWLALGSPGGSRIISTVLQVLLHRAALGMDLAGAVNAARAHHQWFPDRVDLEVDRPGMKAAIAASLRTLGHQVRPKRRFGNVNAAELASDGLRHCAADPRFDGACSGY